MEAYHDLGIRYDECDISIDYSEGEIYIDQFTCPPLIDLRDTFLSDLSASDYAVVTSYLSEIGVLDDGWDE